MNTQHSRARWRKRNQKRDGWNNMDHKRPKAWRKKKCSISQYLYIRTTTF